MEIEKGIKYPSLKCNKREGAEIGHRSWKSRLRQSGEGSQKEVAYVVAKLGQENLSTDMGDPKILHQTSVTLEKKHHKISHHQGAPRHQ